jgi:hypothetical protein
MADFTITIRVTGTAGGQSVSWSAAATVADIDALILNGHNAAQATESGASIITAEGIGASGVGLMSYTGIAVSCVVGEGGSTVTLVTPYDGSLNDNGAFVVPTGIPVITYQGPDFNGAMNIGSSATATPTVDVQSIAAGPWFGFGSFKALAGVKAVS